MLLATFFELLLKNINLALQFLVVYLAEEFRQRYDLLPIITQGRNGYL